jgi:hypothetical protein
MLMGAILGLLGGWAWYAGNESAARWLAGIAGILLGGGLGWPPALRPLYIAWMYLARVLGWVNTYLLLGLVFYTVFALVGALMRVFRHDPLDRRLEQERKSYWSVRQTPLPPQNHYERQF